MDTARILIGCYRLLSLSKKPLTTRCICDVLNVNRASLKRLFHSSGIQGRSGLGFKQGAFRKKFESLLGLKRYRVAIVGWGLIAHELLGCDWLLQNYEIAALFDDNPDLIGASWNGLNCDDICSLSRIINERGIDIAIITGAEDLDKISSELRESKIRGIWNFSPMHIEMPANILVEEAFDGIMRLSFHMTTGKEETI